MSASASKSPSKSATNVSPHMRKKSGREGSSSDELHPDNPIPVQTSTTFEPERFPGDRVGGNPSKRRRVGDTEPRCREANNSRHGRSITVPTIDHPPIEARNEEGHFPVEMPLITPEHPSVGCRGGDVQSREAGHGVDPVFPMPTEATTIAIEPCSAVHRDGDLKNEEVPSISLFQGASNIQNNNANFITIARDATIIRFGDGQFTDVQRNLICDYIANLTVLPDINDNLKKHVLTQSIITLPRAEAVFNDYQTKKKSGPCFEGTRVSLLREMADWITGPDESRMYVLSGLAGIGKSTVAYTIASRAADLNLLGASFFFSRDEADRNNAKRFFTTIAYQLCVYNETFAKAIGDVLLTERGSAATTKDPQVQLQVLILDPLRCIIQSRARPILVVVDALDECDEEDEHAVVTGLSQLVRILPSFKVILTTRPQPLVDYLFRNHDGHQIFHLQDIEDKVVDGDIRLYLSHGFSQEQVRLRLLHQNGEWCANNEDVESLVRASGRLFIFASTAVIYVLNKALGDPGSRMKKLLDEIALDRTPFHGLNHFYSVIVRGAIQVNNDDEDNDDIVDRYQIIVGTIVFIQTPLPVTTLACFIGEESEKIYAMLRNLKSVILLGGGDVPRIYHKSFSDYLTDPARCKDPRLRIDPRVRHTQIATRCFEIMDRYLKRNILGLGDPTRFMNNKDGLKKDRITDEQLQKKIPQQLRYSCVYWVNHLEVAIIEDSDLMNGLEKFADEHLLHWFEVLSLIGNLDLAHRAIRAVLKLVMSTSSDLYQLLSDALRFISRFYQTIERSALHTYYSALSFTPRNSFLYCRYINEAMHNICGIEGGPKKWDYIIANLNHEECVGAIKFSHNNALFVSYSEKYEGIHLLSILQRGILKIWDKTTGTPISTIKGNRFAVANDFSTIVSSEDNTITYYNMNGSTRGSMFTPSAKIEELAISSEISRVAAALSDGTVWLWDSRNAGLIDSFNGHRSWLKFSPTGTRLAYSSVDGIVKLRYGISGRFIANLRCGSHHIYLGFSGDGSRIASLSSDCGLTLWDSESGRLIDAVSDVTIARGGILAISATGSLLATAEAYGDVVKLWSGTHDSLTQIEVLKLGSACCMAFSLDNILAITNIFTVVTLYNIKTCSIIFTLSVVNPIFPTIMALSPNYTHLAVGDADGSVCLCDIQGINASSPPLKADATNVSALALSRDCSRLACGFSNGLIELWRTNPKKRLIASYQACPEGVEALGFGPDCGVFASGSVLGTIKLWNGGDGALRGTCKVPVGLHAVALSNSMVVAAWNGGVTLLSLNTLNPIYALEHMNHIRSLSISDDSKLAAIGSIHGGVTVFDVGDRITIATFDLHSGIHTMTFLPDNSELVVQSNLGDFLSLNLTHMRVIKEPALEHLIQLPNTPLWHGVPIWHCQNDGQHCFSALFSRHKSPVPVLWIPREIQVNKWAQGSTMIALGCEARRVILLRLLTSHVN